MNITSKSRYALKIMMDLSEHGGPGEVIHRSDIASRQGVPLDYMDQILSRLRDKGMIASTRGRAGGYALVRDPAGVSVHEIFTAVEDAFEPVQCLEGSDGCSSEHVCSSKDAWGRISGAIRSALSGIMLSELATSKGRVLEQGLLASVPQECRAPRRRAGGTRLGT